MRIVYFSTGNKKVKHLPESTTVGINKTGSTVV